MNKLFTKVAALTLGVAMAAGVGVAVGASQKASAAEATSYDAVMAKGNNAYDDNTINGKFSIKAGTSSKQGSMTITIPSASAKTLSFYAAAWKGDSTTVDLSSTGVTLGVSSLTLTNDSALTGTGSTWTLNQDEETYFFKLDLTNCTDNAVVTLTAHVASKNRFFVWDAQYDDGESGDVVDVTGVSLDKTSADLVIPNSTTLTATVTPENATNKKVSWSSSNSLVASVANGVVKAVDQGTATITVTTQDGSFTDECVVTVSLPTIVDVTVAQAIEIGAALSDGATSTEYYRVTGYVVAITYEYAQGTMSFTLADEKGGTSTVTCYKFACTEEEAAKIVVDARVSLVGNIQNFVKSSVHTYEFINNIRSQTAFPEEPVTDWSNEQKTALETALHGYLPPFFGELAEDMTTTENSVTFTVSGDLSDQFATKLGDGWVLGSDGSYMKLGDNYYLTASIYVEGVRLPVGDYSHFTFTYHEGQPVQEFTITYLPGNGTGESIEIDVEEGSSHTLRSLDETSFVAPEGQQFKGWQVDNDAELRDPGYVLENVASNVTITAIYEDIPATDWSETFKTTFQSRFGTTYLPPFVNAEFAKESNQKWHSTYPYCKIEVEGNFFSNAATLFNNDSNWHFLGYDEYDCPIFMTSDQKAFVIIDAYMKVEDGPVYTSLTFECVGDYAVVTTDAKTEYYVGDNLDLANVKLCAQLLDGTIVENLTIPQSYWSVSPTALTEAGDQVVITITVAALEEEFTYNVKVTPVMMESISISGELSKTEYIEGDDWDATGLVATAHYNNGAEEDVTAQVSWTFQPEETVAGTTSVSVVATLDEISSEAANFVVVVNEPAPAYDADTFAKDLLDLVAPICANYDGKKNNKAALKTVWDTMSQLYSTLSNEEKAKVIAAAAKADGTDLEKAMAFYNYACKKYGLTKFIEGRQVKALVAEHETGNSILPIVVIVASSVAAITAIGVVIALKRRKTLLVK